MQDPSHVDYDAEGDLRTSDVLSLKKEITALKGG